MYGVNTGNLDGQGKNRVGLHRAIADLVLQRHAVQILHDDERLTILLIHFMDRANVRMIQRGSRLCLALKAGEGLCVFGYIIRQEFESDEAMQFYILGFINHTHPASAQLLDDAVVRNRLPDHWAEILGLEVGQVNEGSEVGSVPTGQLA